MIMKKYQIIIFAMMMLAAMDAKAIDPQPTIQDGDTLEYFTFIRPTGYMAAASSEEFVAWGLDLIDPIPPDVQIASAGGGSFATAVAPGGVTNDNISFEITGDPCFSVFVLGEDLGTTQCRIRILYFPRGIGQHTAKLRLNCVGRTTKEVTLMGYARLAGDMNQDNALDVSDVTTVIGTILGENDGDCNCADVDGSETVDVVDVTLLINELLNAN